MFVSAFRRAAVVNNAISLNLQVGTVLRTGPRASVEAGHWVFARWTSTVQRVERSSRYHTFLDTLMRFGSPHELKDAICSMRRPFLTDYDRALRALLMAGYNREAEQCLAHARTVHSGSVPHVFYHMLLNWYAERGSTVSAWGVVDLLLADGKAPITVTVNILMKLCARVHSIENAQRVLELMQRYNLPVTEGVILAMVQVRF